MDFIASYTVYTLLLLTTILLLYKYFTRNFDYWEKRGVPYVKPLPVVGNFLEVFTFRFTIGHFWAKLYNEFKTPYFGIYILNKPHLIIRSPDLIKAILVTDFKNFCDRSLICDKQCDWLIANMLYSLKNPQWKTVRTKLTPIFTAGKIKNMVGLISKVAEEMKIYITKNVSKNSIEAKELCAKYNTDVVSSCAFGITANCFQYENAKFRKIGRKAFDFNCSSAIRQSCYMLAPSLVKLFRIRFFDRSIADFFREIFWTAIKAREKTERKRNDFIDLIIQLMKQSSPSDCKFEDDVLVAQVAQIFLAGLETTSSTLAFTLYELCLQKDIQNKLRTEIKTVLAQHDGLTYEAIQDMNYLHMVLCETLRKYPVVPFLDRLCMKDYKIPDSDFVIEEGTPIHIPLFGLHYDPQYFPEPEKFDPERFSEHTKSSFPSMCYIPFGEGLRNCIGERFGLLVSKMGLVHILLEYELEVSEDTPVPLKFETKSLLLASTVGLPMKFKKIT